MRKIDRRTLETRAALLTAFRELILTQGYESVAVGDLIRRAGIGRSTFYLHFSNKLALLRYSLEFPCRRLAAALDPDATPDGLVPLLNHFREQRAINRVFFEPPIRSIWVRRLAEVIERNMPRAAGERSRRQMLKLPRSLVALTVAEMQVALITHWLTSAGSVPPVNVAAALITNSRHCCR